MLDFILMFPLLAGLTLRNSARNRNAKREFIKRQEEKQYAKLHKFTQPKIFLEVDWCKKGTLVPVVCGICGAIFIMKNGQGKIFYGDDTKKDNACIEAQHSHSYLTPDYDRFVKGVWE